MPPVSGGDMRNAQNAQAAAALGPVVLASLNPLIAHEQPPANVRVVTLAQARGGWKTALDTLVEEFRPDVAIVAGVHLIEAAQRLRPRVSMLVVDMADVMSHLQKDLDAARRVSLKTLLGTRVRMVTAREEDCALIADRMWVCSADDASRFYRTHHPVCRIDVVPNGVPRAQTVPAHIPALASRPGQGPELLYLGHMSYPPNVVAAERLARGIFPAVREQLPGARLIIAGARRTPRSWPTGIFRASACLPTRPMPARCWTPATSSPCR